MYVLIRLLRVIVIGAIIYFLYKIFWKREGFGFFKTRKKKDIKHPAIEEMKKDPVCGIYLPRSQAIKYTFNNKTHYFCSEECKIKFQKLNR